ncbi:MAG TPA: hypothetical protein DET40_24265 [Lentisphaeria bacterium]|nr:MAG: hypothetical protein A2X45_00025 [Lentisphaerae bacterium GWF2_50_93]HCE46675.1 hypothetical protein [Lentisphaeria bacterium]
MKYTGCAYYPEYWGRRRLKTDIRLMKEAGINIVRIGEFAWSRMETKEGVFNLEWLHSTIEMFGKNGIEVLMCTPTATPPAWLTSNCPDVLIVRPDETRMGHGSRRHYCFSSDTYRHHCRRITKKLSEEISRHMNVTAWQIDNELGPESGSCHCQNCQSRFRTWLKSKYGTIQELNQRWKTAFWSVEFTDWSQISLDDGRVELYSAQKLDSRRFRSDMMIDFGMEQMQIIRKKHPSATVTTNGMGPIFTPINYYKLYEKLDVACNDLYFDTTTMDNDALALDVFRQLKPNSRHWLTETGSGALDHNKPSHKDQFRAWAWSSFAHGAEAFMVFRWRTCLSGQEQELQGILEHSGKPRHRFESVKKCFQEIISIREIINPLPLPEAQVAIIQDYETLWGYDSARIGKDIEYINLIGRLHREFYRRNILTDIIPPGRDLNKYKLIVLPSLLMISEEFASNLKGFVRKGGTVLAIGQLGIRDFNDNYIPAPGPAHLEKLFGIGIEGGIYLRSHCDPDLAMGNPNLCKHVEVGMAGKLNGAKVSGKAKIWIGDISVSDADVLLTFSEDLYKGQAAITENKTGKGRAVYSTGIRLSEDINEKLLDYVLSVSKIKNGPPAPLHVEVINRGNFTFAINHNPEPASVPLGISGKAVIGKFKDGTANLPAYGVCVVRK